MKRLAITAALGTATAVLFLSGCSSDDSSPKEQATKAAADLCDGLSTLKADQAKLAALDPATTTKDQLGDAVKAVQKDWESVASSLGDLDSAKKSAVQSAVGDLKSGYADLPGDATGADAQAKLKPQVQKLDETLVAASAGVKCG
ncbi:hypothetical protein [Streptomyces sp. NPDC096339]|uniref:hypothetical protein n=1 Tax=Streptomyces sp. NPDC096339 TaxID=3366086 RepID=UPI0038107780